MNSRKFSEALNHIDDRYIYRAILYRGREEQKTPVWMKWGAVAACLCMLFAGGVMLMHNSTPITNDQILVPNPIVTVTDVKDLKQYVGSSVPVLDKEVESYSAIVLDDEATIGQIYYKDGSAFRMQKGSGDISGIYDASLVSSKDISGLTVKYYKTTNASYAIWEMDGYAFSYVYVDDNADSEIEDMIGQLK